MKGAFAAAILGTLFVLLGLAVAAFFMNAAWEHNPQGEFHEVAVDGSELIHWGRWGLVGLLWSWPLLMIGAGVLALARSLSNRRSAG
jgi:hypothetical protein